MNAWASPWDSPPSPAVLGEAYLTISPSLVLGSLVNDAQWGEDKNDFLENPERSAPEFDKTKESSAHTGRQISQQNGTLVAPRPAPPRHSTTPKAERRNNEICIVADKICEETPIRGVTEPTQNKLNTPYHNDEVLSKEIFQADDREYRSKHLENWNGTLSLVATASNLASPKSQYSPSIPSQCEPQTPETPTTSVEDEDTVRSSGEEDVSVAPDGVENVSRETSGPGGDEDFSVFVIANAVQIPETLSPLSANPESTEQEILATFSAKQIPEEHLETADFITDVSAYQGTKLKSWSVEKSEQLQVALASEDSPSRDASLFSRREGNQEKIKQSICAEDFFEQFLTGHGRQQQKTPGAGDSTAPTKSDFAADLPTTSNLLPISTESEPSPELNTIIISSTSERKTWSRISRKGTVEEHNTDNIDNYVRVTWPGSAIRARVIETVRHWASHEHGNGGTSTFGISGGRPGIRFEWTEPESQKDVDYSSQAAAIERKAAGPCGVPPSSALQSSPPIVLKTRFSWTSSPPNNTSPHSTLLPSNPNPDLSISASPVINSDYSKSPVLKPVPLQHDLRMNVELSVSDDPWGSLPGFELSPSPSIAICKSSSTQLQTSQPKALHAASGNPWDPSIETDPPALPSPSTFNFTQTKARTGQFHTNHTPRFPSLDSSISFSPFTATAEPLGPDDLKIVQSIVEGLPDLSYMLR